MSAPLRPPAARPCGTCPYRRDVPSGVWDAEEYAKLRRYDGDTASQPPAPFGCHQQDGRMCAGWVGCHDQSNLLAVRIWAIGTDPADVDAVLDYETDVPLFDSGAEAAAHGMRAIENPDERGRRAIADLLRKRAARQRRP